MFIFLNQLLKKALIRDARNHSVAAAMASATIQYNHSAYIIKVLEAPVGIRVTVRAEAIANVAASDSPGQKQLVCILTLFETLPADQKAAFIYSYKAAAGLAGHGPMSIVLQNTYQSGHNPPVYEP